MVAVTMTMARRVNDLICFMEEALQLNLHVRDAAAAYCRRTAYARSPALVARYSPQAHTRPLYRDA